MPVFSTAASLNASHDARDADFFLRNYAALLKASSRHLHLKIVVPALC